MSKFFNETQKAHQWAQQKLANQDVDVKEMLESLKQGPASGTPLADARLDQCRQVHVGNGNMARLVLNQGDASRAALEAYRGLRTRLMRAQAKTGLKSIAVTSSLPGEGKTLTTMNLGLCYAQLPQQRVLVIDADLRACGLTAMLDPTIPALLDWRKFWQAKLRPTRPSWRPIKKTCSFCPPGPFCPPLRNFSPGRGGRNSWGGASSFSKSF